MKLDPKEIKELAEKELREEKIRHEVEIYKAKLRARPWWDRLFPWKFTFRIERRFK